jgi:ferredoxin
MIARRRVHRLLIPTAILVALGTAFALGWVYQVDPALCNGCGACLNWCSEGAISMQGMDAYIDPELCNACGICATLCPRGAIYRTWYTSAPEQEAPQANLSVTPNPATPMTVVTVTGTSFAPVSLFDVCGRRQLSTTLDEDGLALLDLSGLPAGAYVVVLSPSGESVFLTLASN